MNRQQRRALKNSTTFTQREQYTAAGKGNLKSAKALRDNEQPKNFNGYRVELVKWVMNDFAQYNTYKNGHENVLEDFSGDRQRLDIELMYLFLARSVYVFADLLSMSDITIDNIDAPRRDVSLEEAIQELDKNLKEYGHSEVLGMGTNYACYEAWDNIFMVREELVKLGCPAISQEDFGVLVKFLYDGYSGE